MRILFKSYVSLIYLVYIFLLIYLWTGINFNQIMITISLVILTKLINNNIVRDLQSNISYFIIFPFVIPALVYLDSFYSIMYIGLFQIINIIQSPFYKRFFNASVNGISMFLAGIFISYFIPTNEKQAIFSAVFFVVLFVATFIFSIFNKLNTTIVISLEKGKFDMDSVIGAISAFKTSYFTIFLGLINVVLFHYTNIIGVAIFTFVIYFLKPALTYRHIFDNELSTYTNFVLHMLKQMDPITHQHSERVKFWTVMLAKKMKLPSSEIRQLSQAASWHDIGKIEVPFDILNKPGRLTDEEYNIIKHHPEAGYQLVKDVHFFKKFLPVIRHHHEKVDGTGYPHGLVGDKIPLHARIMAITDAFDAMTFDRSYRKAMSMAKAVEELKKYAGKQFDANIVAIFIEALQDEYGQEFEDFDEKIIMNVS